MIQRVRQSTQDYHFLEQTHEQDRLSANSAFALTSRTHVARWTSAVWDVAGKHARKKCNGWLPASDQFADRFTAGEDSLDVTAHSGFQSQLIQIEQRVHHRCQNVAAGNRQ